MWLESSALWMVIHVYSRHHGIQALSLCCSLPLSLTPSIRFSTSSRSNCSKKHTTLLNQFPKISFLFHPGTILIILFNSFLIFLMTVFFGIPPYTSTCNNLSPFSCVDLPKPMVPNLSCILESIGHVWKKKKLIPGSSPQNSWFSWSGWGMAKEGNFSKLPRWV